MAEKDYENLGEVFARNVRFRRTQKEMTQTDVARLMKERGFAFHQQTVQRIEDGQRPVKLEEAYALSRIFDISVDHMAWDFENMRAHDISQLGNASLELISNITQGVIEWEDQLAAFASQVTYLESREDEPARTAAGAWLIDRSASWMSRAQKLSIEMGDDFFEDIYKRFGGTDDIDEPEEPDEPKVAIAEFLDTHPRDPRMSDLSVDELAELYIRPGGEKASAILSKIGWS